MVRTRWCLLLASLVILRTCASIWDPCVVHALTLTLGRVVSVSPIVVHLV